ncbi:Peroxisome biogenesis protein 22 [Acorus calamus]|uniref:Peroxisome biogenesis protein 22 n=1 Tax=Acorus calamus TaxID=4465 RepID=A0AAV9D652_ACOCL|nr:Peroxisome biogenesis protein 22 [Acorus calamus]
MSDNLTQSVLDLLKRLGTNLNRKVSEVIAAILNHKAAGSLGAIAGFAIAVIFTWKFLRPPVGPWRRLPKPRDSDDGDSQSSGLHSLPQLDFDDQVSVEGPPEKIAIRRMVWKKLNGGRRVTCQLLGIILVEKSPEELQKHATVRLSVVDILLEICRTCDLYLMERILDDESEERVLLALENAGLFTSGGLMKDKVLFCSTENGRASFVRQIEPDWHIDTNLK